VIWELGVTQFEGIHSPGAYVPRACFKNGLTNLARIPQGLKPHVL
jgi:hypothetical protein